MSNELDYIEFLSQEGSDAFLEEEPTNKTVGSAFAGSASKKDFESREAIVSKSSIVEESQSISGVVEEDKTIDLSTVDTLEKLREAIQNFNHPLKEKAMNMVFSRGNPNSPKVMFIGEAPGQQEDIKGLPFVGEAGQLLDKMISAIDLTSDDFYISNVINYRPENNRTPDDNEISSFLPFLKKHIELVKPKVICILGAVSLKALFPNSSGITRSRGQWMDFSSIPTIATFHPAYLLRFPVKKREAWEDLKSLQEKIK